MNPPLAIHLHIADRDKRPIRLWLPLFLLWPLLALLLALPLLIAALVDAVLWLAGRRYHHYSYLIVHTLALFCAMKGTVIRINDGDTIVDVTID